MKIVHTTGYTGQDVNVLPDLLERMNAVLCDIRFSPHSRHERWRERSLRNLLGARYVHLIEFGNEAFRIGEIKIHDFSAGLRKLETLLQLYDGVILMCACKEYELCHRRTVAEELLSLNEFEIYDIEDWAEMLESMKTPSLF